MAAAAGMSDARHAARLARAASRGSPRSTLVSVPLALRAHARRHALAARRGGAARSALELARRARRRGGSRSTRVFLPALSCGAHARDLARCGRSARFVALIARLRRASGKAACRSSSRARARRTRCASCCPTGAARFPRRRAAATARVLARLAAARPESRFEGIEQALRAVAPGAAALLAERTAECRVRRGDLWSVEPRRLRRRLRLSLAGGDGRASGRKRRAKCARARCWSARSRCPACAPTRSIDVGDTMRTRLHVWRIGPEGGAA